ncbi:DUF5405 family protein [Salmonella enterica]|nr:hypothetical protein [Salmonella enterica]EGZ3674086.1 hypothetical protein [Salmonella enterica]EKS9425833.1 DUF5405 family protein [Salmonella enterica]ELX7303869.1 DUF5405 family protein [Salmonella enterica]
MPDNDHVSSVIINKWLVIGALPSGDYQLAELRHDKQAEGFAQIVIAIYQNELNLISDSVNLLVKRAVFCRGISTNEELATLTAEFVQSCISGIEMLKNKEGKNVNSH